MSDFHAYCSPTLEAIVVRTALLSVGVLALVAGAVGFGVYALLT
jgi:hypothetical protein